MVCSSPASTPPLLQLAECLADSWWAECLLPKLVEAEAAGNLAMACKQLRGIVQRSVTQLTLPERDLQSATQQDLERLPACFPSCKLLEFYLATKEGVAFHMPDALAVLTRLTKVTDLSVHILIDETANDPFVLVPAINAIGTFLSTLHQKQKQAHAVSHCLTLSLSGSWEPHSRVWKALGDLTTLSKLSIHADESQWEACGISMQRLSALAPLGSGLQFLDVLTGRLHAQQDYSFLGSLTALTGLQLQLASVQGLTSISSITTLRQLYLAASFQPAARKPELGPAECAAIGQLSQLTLLFLVSINVSNDDFSFLSGLKQLVELRARSLTPAVVPVLAGLTKLTGLHASWLERKEWRSGWYSTDGKVCTSVTLLSGRGPIPFQAFPAVEAALQWGPWEPHVYLNMAKHCKQLEALLMHSADVCDPGAEAGGFMPQSLAGLANAERTSAVAALGQLPRLTALAFGAGLNADIAALANLHQLQSLDVALPPGSKCSSNTFAHLAALRQLQALKVQLRDSSGLNEQQARQLLGCVGHVRRVIVAVVAEQEAATASSLQQAQLMNAAAGLQGPGKVQVLALHIDDRSDSNGDSESDGDSDPGSDSDSDGE